MWIAKMLKKKTQTLDTTCFQLYTKVSYLTKETRVKEKDPVFLNYEIASPFL